MLKHTLTFSARDLLFFRDARPMGGSDEGAGARWPLPNVLHSAILSAFHERWPELDERQESHHVHRRADERNFDRSSLRFGGLRTLGPFPLRTAGQPDGTAAETLFLPCPADLVPGGIMRPVAWPPGTTANLPAPLRYAVAANAAPTKETLGDWLPVGAWRKYLSGGVPTKSERPEALYDCETRPGVSIDPTTHANREHLFYQAEYLRLRDGVTLRAWVQAEALKYGQQAGQGMDIISAFSGTGLELRFGGQGGIAKGLVARPASLDLPEPASTSTHLKWILLTPALFAAGWRPGWVDGQSGEIKLTVLANGCKLPIHGVLVAARVPKPITVSGWKLDKSLGHAGGTPKATRLLAPAGSVYYFELADAESASRLVHALHLKPKSDSLGEKGFGLGVCGTWEPLAR